MRFLQGQCSEDEIAEMSEWIALSDENANEAFGMQRLYEHLQAKTINKDEVEEALQKSLRRNRPRRLVVPRWLSYAATLLVGLVLGATAYFALQYSKKGSAEIIFADGNINKELSLPDGTRIWLNKGARLWFPAEFDGDTREVRMEGEGYFEVAKDKAHPFIINNEVMTVRVLGTKFNYKAERSHGEVALLEGSVAVTSGEKKQMQLLQPGQKIEVDGNKQVVSNVNTGMEVVWHTGLIPFKNANISSIAAALESLYGVKVIVGKGVDLNHTYSGVIEYKENIDSVMMLLQQTLPVRYSIKGKTVTLRPQ